MKARILKAKIAVKLFLFFLTALLLATAVTGGLFCFLIARHTTAIFKNDLTRRAQVMSRTLSRIYEMSSGNHRRNPVFAIRNLHEISLADVWLIDQNMNVVTMAGHGIPPRPPRFEDVPQFSEEKKLPPGADEVLKKAFAGQASVTEVFNPVLEIKSLTAATPVYERESQNVVWVLLLHSPIVGLREAILQSVRILAGSAACAFLLALLAAALLSRSFTKPIEKMNSAAKELAKGNYSIKTGVKDKNELGELAATLDALAVQLKDASEESARLENMRRDFIANVSHELRTPVTVIRGSLEALVDGVVSSPNDVAEYQGQMLKETIHLQRLVNDLLELSRLQTVDFKIESEPFDIKEAACEAARAIQKAAAAKNVSIKIERTEGQKIIQGDSGRVRQMFMTILDNAVKFSPEGGEVVMKIGDDEIAVIDGGSGISAEYLPHVFERFKKESSARNKEGSGLGLAIAREIAARHNFHLSAQSPVDGGAGGKPRDPKWPGSKFTCKLQ
ncbi:MAG: ATP-binding protein [Treponema sp.]|nr:ATP-binding protein [Treponema sp.]MEE3434043.1 ATP-binding protein [Treponema sp.]